MRIAVRAARWTTIATLASAAVLAGCGTGVPGPGGGTPAAPTAPAAPTTVVMIIRHAEKPDGSEPGVDADGNQDDGSLTATGWDRAHRLVDLFDPARGAPRPGLARPATLYAAGANDDGEGARTRETVAPLAAALGLPVNTAFGKGEEERLVEHVRTHPGPTLICWSHSGIPTLAQAFPKVTPEPPAEWPDDRFDLVWTLTKTSDGWRFTQTPELVLPGDDDHPINDDDKE